MRAIVINSFSEKDNLELVYDAAVPSPGPQEVLIKIKAAGVGLWDSKVRQDLGGLGKSLLPFPIKMGWEGSGVITGVGSEVKDFKPGDEALAYAEYGGTWAEYVTVPANAVGHKPGGLSFVEAAALPINGVTAHQSIMDDLKVKSGETILVTAAAGGTGILAVQLAARLGAKVIATAREHNHALLKGLGASATIDYSQEDYVEAVHRLYPGGVDVLLECADAENLFKSLDAVKPGGRAGSIVGWDKTRPVKPDVKPKLIIGGAEGSRMAEVAQLAEKGELKIPLNRTWPLEEAYEALKTVESRHFQGKVILTIS